jgi:deoxyribonuclease IV
LFVETAGKLAQLGSLEEILENCSQVEGVHPCVDFGHVHARTLGSLATPGAIRSLVLKIEWWRLHFSEWDY